MVLKTGRHDVKRNEPAGAAGWVNCSNIAHQGQQTGERNVSIPKWWLAYRRRRGLRLRSESPPSATQVWNTLKPWHATPAVARMRNDNRRGATLLPFLKIVSRAFYGATCSPIPFLRGLGRHRRKRLGSKCHADNGGSTFGSGCGSRWVI
jgi:hypothetical protein